MKGTEKCLIGIIKVLAAMPVSMKRPPTRQRSSGITTPALAGTVLRMTP